MGIAYSNGPIIRGTLRRDTSAHFRADLDAALGLAGWNTKTTVTNGLKYTITSPQGYSCKVLVQDQGHTIAGFPTVTVQLLSADETLVGFEHWLILGLNPTYQPDYELVAGECQFFLAPLGIADETAISVPTVGQFRNYSVAGGIPYVAAPTGACAAAGGSNPAVTQIFWSSGMGSFNTDFRCGRFCSNNYCYCLNGNIVVAGSTGGINGPDTGYTGGLKIYPLTPTYDVDFWFSRNPAVVKYQSKTPLYIDALIGWEFGVQGQLWDALMSTYLATLESIIVSTETDAGGNTLVSRWMSWNHLGSAGQQGGTGTYYGTLYLLIQKPMLTFARGGNYAY